MDHCLKVLQEEMPLHLSLHLQEQRWQWVCIPKSKPDLPFLLSLSFLSPCSRSPREPALLKAEPPECPCLDGAPGPQSRALLEL